MKEKLLLRTAAVLVTSAFSLNTFAQDIHFSQYTETPSLINPALTGSSHIIKAYTIYKDQWKAVTVPYRTFGAAYEMKFKSKVWEEVDPHMSETYRKAFSKMAGGLAFFSDKAGDGKMGTTRCDLSLATAVTVGAKSLIFAGLQAGLVQRSIDVSKLVWPDQYNGTGYDPNINPGENFGSSRFLYPDYAAGLLFSYGGTEKYLTANDQFKLDIGGSIFHISRPAQKFLSGGDRMDYRIVAHGKSLIGIKNTNLSLVPSYLLQFQGPAKEIVMGMMFRYRLKEDSKYTGYVKGATFSLGGFYRNKDAMIVSTMIEFAQYAIGMSYDINTSDLHTVSTYRGGLEICLRFVSPSPFLYQTRSSF